MQGYKIIKLCYDYFSQHDLIFADVNKIGYFKSSKNKSNLGKGNNVIISIDAVTSKIFIRKSNSVIDVIM